MGTANLKENLAISIQTQTAHFLLPNNPTFRYRAWRKTSKIAGENKEAWTRMSTGALYSGRILKKKIHICI